jgi:hypothetical protein
MQREIRRSEHNTRFETEAEKEARRSSEGKAKEKVNST